MPRSIRLVISIILLSVLLMGCYPGRRGGLEFYGYGYPWETDGNTVLTVDASVSKLYHSADCETYEAEEGEIFVIVRCKARFAQGWAFSNESYLSGYGATAPYISLFLFDPAGSPDDDGYDTYYLLFCMDEASYSGELSDYWIRIQIGESDAVQRYQDFTLYKPMN